VTVHFPPHRWADLWAGRVGEAERIEMERHALSCRACQRSRQRVSRASDTFATIRTQSSPEVLWDAVRARVHWSVSTERRASLQQRRPAYGWLIGAVAAGVAVALLVGHPPEPAPVIAPGVVRHEPVTPAPAAPDPLIGLVTRASGDVMINGVRPTDLFARKLVPGTTIATGDGRVDIQFADNSAFALAPKSTLELRAFDRRTVELVVDGTVDVVVTARAADQRFAVVAGDQRVEVRGTQFRVSHDAGSTTVACRHGVVAVSDATGAVEVGTARRVQVGHGAALAADRVVALSSEELNQLAQATPLALPLWDPAALVERSAPLEVATSGRRDVRVDGVELGLAPLRVRVMPGRHTVEAADSAGRFRRAGWIDVAAAPHGVRLDVPAEPPPTGGTSGISERRRQLLAKIDRPRLGRCMRSIAKAGLTGTYVQVELAVDAHGAIGFLNVIDTDLPSATASCIRDVLTDVRFGAGAAATWRERVDL
jgi:hypothetical protein